MTARRLDRTNATIRSTAGGRRLIAGAGRACDLEQFEPRQLMAVDPVTPNNPVWFATYGTPSFNGTLNSPVWATAPAIVRTLAGQTGSSVTLRMLYNQQGLYIGADVRDQYVNADGNGGGTGNPWEWTNDDGLGVYFDPFNTRKLVMGPGGRFFGTNLGAPNGPTSGSGIVSRWDYLKGNGQGWGTDVNPGDAISPGMTWKTRINGTVNNNSDIDVGWTMEMFLPWSSINLPGMPANGQFVGMNFQVFSDNTGGVPSTSSTTTSSNANQRLGPAVTADDVQGVLSSYQNLWSGFSGPVDYAQLVFVNPSAPDHPSTISNLTATAVTGYSTHLNFTAPSASLTGSGSVSAYQIRVSTSPILSQTDWNNATVVANSFTPKQAGLSENLAIGLLQPSTTYYVAVRAVDSAGRLGNIAATTFTTQSTAQDTSGGQRLMVSPDGGYLMTESGVAFTMIQSPAVPNMRYLRNIYPGEVWSNGYNTLTNYTVTPGPEGGVAGYFSSLVADGVTTLRVSLEYLATPTAAASQFPSGEYWLESSPGVFNPAMKAYLQTMMQQAAAAGLRLILDPFDTYDYATDFNMTAFSSKNGGPLTTINNFFQTPAVLDMSLTRMQTIIDWVRQSPYSYTVLGYDLINEWDATTWTINPIGNGDGARTAEMRQRATFMVQLAAKVHAYDPQALLIDTGDDLAPTGPAGRAVFLSDAFDVLTPHLYTTSTGEPINNPDTDKSIRPATDYGNIAAYWLTMRRANQPIDNGEWGLTTAYWPNNTNFYGTVNGQTFTLAQDTAIYRTTSWVTLASGFDGSGLRLSGSEARSLLPNTLTPATTGYVALPLPTPMRQIQQSISTFVDDTSLDIDWTTYDPTTINGHARVSTMGNKSVLTYGSTNGEEGLLYVLQNTNKSSGTISKGTLTIDDLDPTKTYAFQFWSTGPNPSVISQVSNVTVVNGVASIALPKFSQDMVIKFKAL